MKKRNISLMLILCMVISCVMSTCCSVSAQETDISSAGADYGLPDNCRDGNILQCFNWTLAQIQEELPNIAAAGFTSVQTSPLQAHIGANQWYWLYQPTGFTLGNELGSYNDLKALCTEADRYGIKIIVDVVANHLAGDASGKVNAAVESVFRNNMSLYFHNQGLINNYASRSEVIYKNMGSAPGLPDLNTENTAVQDIVIAMVEKLKSAGVDGIRWDAAKHIGLPSEDSEFWSRIAEIDMYHYGEILDSPGNSPTATGSQLMKEYAQYINITDNGYSNTVTDSFKKGTRIKKPGYWSERDIPVDRIVYWGESHDTFSNDGGSTKETDQNIIDRTYAVLASRANSQTMYLSRPSQKVNNSIYYGRKGSTHFTSPEIAAVNRFHNAMVGTDELFVSRATYNVISREGGAVIVLPKESDVDITVPNTDSMVPAGTYTDEVSGSEFTVTAEEITGHVGATGIAVIYNGTPAETVLNGDANDDDEVTIVDVTTIQRVLLDMHVKSYNEKAADVDGNGDVEISDATRIQRFLLDLGNPFHINERIPIA